MCSGQRRDRKAGEPRTSRFTLGLPPSHIGRTKSDINRVTAGWRSKPGRCRMLCLLSKMVLPPQDHPAWAPHPLCLAYEALNQCLRKTTAVAEPSTHIRRRPWKGSGTSCYHRAASVEPCRGRGERGQRATHCSAALQNHLHTEIKVTARAERGCCCSHSRDPSLSPPRLPWGITPAVCLCGLDSGG